MDFQAYIKILIIALVTIDHSTSGRICKGERKKMEQQFRWDLRWWSALLSTTLTRRKTMNGGGSNIAS